MTGVLLLLLWLLGPQASTSTIQGIVVRSGTTQPLVNETVGLWPTTRTLRTTSEGRFLFQNVATGEYALTVVRDGMKVQVPVTITAAQRTETVTVEVKPPPAVTGTVFDPNGERVAATRVQAFRTVYSPTGPRVRSVMSVLTDDLGEFRLFWLRSGEYYIAAGFSDRERRLGAKGLRFTPNLSAPDDGLPTIYYGGEHTPYQSQKVRLGQDTDSSGLQIFLKDGPQFSVSGRLLPDGACARLVMVPEGGIVNTDTDISANMCGSYRIAGLSPGTYFIFAANDVLASEVLRVGISSQNVELNIPLLSTITINGRITGEGRPPYAGATLKLSRSSRDITQEFEFPVAANGLFNLPNIPVGLYDVSIPPLPDGVPRYVSSISYGPTDGLLNPISVDASPRALNIQMGLSNAVAQGIVVDRSGRPVPGAEVVFVPRAQRSRADRYLAVTADAGGNFRMTGIPPIDYSILAFEDIEPQAYYAFAYDPGLFTRMTVNAQNLYSNASDTMLRLVAIPASETAGGLR